MTELVGFKELTPYRGGWCGNEIFATAFPPKTRQKARELTFKFGRAVEARKAIAVISNWISWWSKKIRGDLSGRTQPTYHRRILHDQPRRIRPCGRAAVPVPPARVLRSRNSSLDVEELNARWANPDMIDSWSQMVIKHTEDSVDVMHGGARRPESTA